MKLLIITNLFPNKSEPQRAVYNKQQFAALSQLCELKIVAPIPFLKYTSAQVSEVETTDGVEVFHPRYLVIPKILRDLYGFLFYLGISERIREIYHSFRFDLILATWAYPDAFAAALIAKRFNKPLVIKVHGTDINVLTQFYFRRKMILYAFHQAQKIIAVSETLRKKIIELGVPSEKVVLIPNGVDTELFRPLDKKESRLKLAIPLEQKVVLFVGNLEPIKGIDLLVDAMHRVPEETHLYIIGDGSLKSDLEIRAKDLTMAERIHFVGRQSHLQIPFWMSASDVFCLPSRNEGCPNVILEALACGTPIVATNVGGIPQLIKDPNQGILVAPNDPSDISDGIKTSFLKKWDRELLRKSVLAYDWDQNAEDLLKEITQASIPKPGIVYHHRTQGTGAEGVHISFVMNGFRKLQNEVFVVSPTNRDPAETAGGNPYGKKMGLASILWTVSRIVPQFMFEMMEMAYNVSAYFKLKKILKRKSIEFIYERNAFFLVAGTYLAKKRKIPIIVEVNEVAGQARVRKQTFVKLAKRCEKYVFDNAAGIVVVSEFLKDQILALGVDEQKIHILANAADEEIFSPFISGVHLREKYRIDKETVAIGFIGWFVPWHNLDFLIDVFSRVARERKVVLFLIGEGVLKEKLQTMINYKGIHNKVIFTSAVPYAKIPEYISMLDICVIPGSNEYRSPIKMFEYMSMAKPVVAPRYEPIQSIIEDGVDGMIFDPSSKSSLEKCLSDLIVYPDKRRALGEAARKKILHKHTWLMNAQYVMNLIKKGE